MNLGSWIILGIIVAGAGFAVRSLKKGGGCSSSGFCAGGCQGCNMCKTVEEMERKLHENKNN